MHCVVCFHCVPFQVTTLRSVTFYGWTSRQTCLYAIRNLTTKFHDCLNNAVNKQLSTHFDWKIYAVTNHLGWYYVCIHFIVTLIIPVG